MKLRDMAGFTENDFTPYKRGYYMKSHETKKDGTMYQILIPCDYVTVEDGYKYGHYDIDGKIYESLYTNNPFGILDNLKSYTQLSLFDLESEDEA